jgi:hypothetical protein
MRRIAASGCGHASSDAANVAGGRVVGARLLRPSDMFRRSRPSINVPCDVILQSSEGTCNVNELT